MSNKDLLLIYPKIEADPVLAYCEGVAAAYESITGNKASLFYNMSIGAEAFPDHGVIHYRGSGPVLMRRLGEHQADHKCTMINDEKSTNNGANKLRGIELASTVMRAPKTIRYNDIKSIEIIKD